ncbi:MAG: sigma-70 family RNA polymerase sigma factor [Myxococcota bacterium]
MAKPGCLGGWDGSSSHRCLLERPGKPYTARKLFATADVVAGMVPSASRPEPAAIDRDLVARCVAREPRALDELVERFGRLVHAVVLRTHERHGQHVDDDRMAELFSASFLALLDDGGRRIRQWDGRCALASWVRLVAASVTLDRLRTERRAGRRVSDAVDIELLPSDEAGALERAERLEEHARLERALAMLSDGDRELLRLLYMEEVPAAEAAARLGVAAGALYTRKNRALQRLRDAFGRAAEPEV